MLLAASTLAASTLAASTLAASALAASTLAAQTPDAATLASLKWRSIGPVNMAGRMTDVAVDPGNSRIFYVAGAGGGVWKTVNAGTTFFSVWNDMPVSSFGDIAVAPSSPSIVYAGTGDQNSRNSVMPGYGIYKSTDGGKTFKSINSNLPDGSGVPASSYVIREDPVNPNLLHVGNGTDVFASLNKGQSWFPISNNLPTVPVDDRQVRPRDRELIAGTHGRAAHRRQRGRPEQGVMELQSGRGGRGFPDSAQVPGFPRGFDPRPAESFGPADSSGSRRPCRERAAGRRDGDGDGAKGPVA